MYKIYTFILLWSLHGFEDYFAFRFKLLSSSMFFLFRPVTLSTALMNAKAIKLAKLPIFLQQIFQQFSFIGRIFPIQVNKLEFPIPLNFFEVQVFCGNFSLVKEIQIMIFLEKYRFIHSILELRQILRWGGFGFSFLDTRFSAEPEESLLRVGIVKSDFEE